jgi:Leucine-rich repeat (LRR) protein
LTLITPNGQNQKGGLQALRSLRKLSINYCEEFLSAYSSSSCCPFPSSLQELSLRRVYMETLECLSNLTCLTILEVEGIELRSEDLWHLLSMGQLRELDALGTQFMSFPVPVQDEQEQLLLSRSCKLYKLRTGDIQGFLCGSVCRVLSFSLTILDLYLYQEFEGFTKEQEEALHLLTSLQELKLHELRSLPEGLNKLTSLKRLVISDCPSIRCLPKDGLPSSLQTLDVSYCKNDELKEQCRQLTIPEIKT